MQATSDKTASANFTQTGETVSDGDSADDVTYGKNGYNPYYQWGRKDAFRSREYTTAPGPTADIIYSGTSVTIGKSIQNPTTHYCGGSDDNLNPYNPYYYNAWNATATTYSDKTDKVDVLEKTVKTVYDPCPTGYTVPSANTFTGLNGTNCPIVGNGRQYTVNGSELFFMWAAGRLATSGAESGGSGNYWLAVSCTADFGRRLVVTSRVSCDDGVSRANGFNIRPVREN